MRTKIWSGDFEKRFLKWEKKAAKKDRPKELGTISKNNLRRDGVLTLLP